MHLSGWGHYPIIQAEPVSFKDQWSFSETLSAAEGPLITVGNSRSYGDSALSERFVSLRNHDRFLAFDEKSGLLTCQSGVLLSEIINTFLPRGWFLKVTPGTKLITVGGAIASDVHGKNHHVAGCFGNTVKNLWLMLHDGSVKRCSREESPELFKATCGGMGLTGVILQASFYLEPVKSTNIEERTIKCRNLDETFCNFEQFAEWPYSVAWMDCMSNKKNIGRSVIMVGRFATHGGMNYHTAKSINIFKNFPNCLLNNFSVSAYNSFYYAKTRSGGSINLVDVESFFYPLDALNNWYRIYGKNGFLQYQFILPKKSSYSGLTRILEKIVKYRFGSFLAVLKLHGPSNNNFLSFPMEGYSLALDFKMQPGLFDFLNQLDHIVLKHGGRFYLAKDARVRKEIFEEGYPGIVKFRSLRNALGLNKKFNSLQSRRLEL